MVSPSAVVCVVILAVAVTATNVNQCPGKSVENLTSNVQLDPCTKPPCKLKKNTNQHISIKFTPEKDAADVKNHVTAEVFGVPLPFVGVDLTSICDKIHTESGEKSSCPVKAGNTYVYKDSFPVLSFYPTLTTVVKWELLYDNTDTSIVCFQVRAKIVN